MDEQRKKKKINFLIVILVIIILIGVSVFVRTAIYEYDTTDSQIEVVTDEDESSNSADDESGDAYGMDENMQPNQADNKSVLEIDTINEEKTTTGLYLYKRNPDVNASFSVGNMFPGDVITKNFCVNVSHHDNVTVKYHVNIRPGYEKLAEVLKCKIVLVTTGETMYDGLLCDIPESLNHNLYTSKKVSTNLNYGVSVYLETSVGNEYQYQELVADFSWGVDDRENLSNSPQTGDKRVPVLGIGLTIGAMLILILLLIKRRKEKRNAYDR